MVKRSQQRELVEEAGRRLHHHVRLLSRHPLLLWLPLLLLQCHTLLLCPYLMLQLLLALPLRQCAVESFAPPAAPVKGATVKPNLKQLLHMLQLLLLLLLSLLLSYL